MLLDRPSIDRVIYLRAERGKSAFLRQDERGVAPSRGTTINGVGLSSSVRVSYYVQLARDADGRKVYLRSES